MLPKIRGLYAKEQLAFTDFPYTEPEIDAIFLSHAHFDHVAHICFVDPQILARAHESAIHDFIISIIPQSSLVLAKDNLFTHVSERSNAYAIQARKLCAENMRHIEVRMSINGSVNRDFPRLTEERRPEVRIRTKPQSAREYMS